MPLDTEIGESGYPRWLEKVRREVRQLARGDKARARFAEMLERCFRDHEEVEGCIVEEIDAHTLAEQYTLLAIIECVVSEELPGSRFEPLISPGPNKTARQDAWNAYQQEVDKAVDAHRKRRKAYRVTDNGFVFDEDKDNECRLRAIKKGKKRYERACKAADRAESEDSCLRSGCYAAQNAVVREWMKSPPTDDEADDVGNALKSVKADLDVSLPADAATMPSNTYPPAVYAFLERVAAAQRGLRGLPTADLTPEERDAWQVAVVAGLVERLAPMGVGSGNPWELRLTPQGGAALARQRLAPAEAATAPAPVCSPDFTTLDYKGTRYTFAKGQQAEAVRALWEAGGHSLTQETIGEKAGSNATRFRLAKLFNGHPAWGVVIVAGGKGCYRIPR